MEQEKNNKKVYIIIIAIMAFLLIALIGVYTASKVVPSTSDDNPTEEPEFIEEDDSENIATTVTSENFLGKWYASEKSSEVQNASYLTVKSVENGKVTFDLYISRVAGFREITTEVVDNRGEIDATSDNGSTDSADPGKIKGYIEFYEGKIILFVEETDLLYVAENTQYTFTYRKNA